MSLEGQPKPPNPPEEKASIKPPEFGAAPAAETAAPRPDGGAKAEIAVETPSAEQAFSDENKARYSQLSSSGKAIVQKMYDGIYKIPVVGRIKAKLDIAHHEYWMQETQAAALKSKTVVNSYEGKITGMQASKEVLNEIIAEMQADGVSGGEKLQLKVQKIEAALGTLENKKNEAQTKFEARENLMKRFANKRDEVANKMVGAYEQKLQPMEATLNELHGQQDQWKLEVAIAESQYKEQEERAKTISTKITNFQNKLKLAGLTDKDIAKNEGILELIKQTKSCHERIAIRKEELAAKKSELDAKIARTDAKANPYRDKREAFARIKNVRPVPMPMAERTRTPQDTPMEEIRGRARTEEPALSSAETLHGAMAEVSAEGRAEAMDKKIPMLTHLTKWNEFLAEHYGAKATADRISVRDFFNAMKTLSQRIPPVTAKTNIERELALRMQTVTPATTMEVEDIKKIITAYTLMKSTSSNPAEQKKRLEQDLETFFSENTQS